MADEVKLHRQRAIGQEAQRLWENSTIQEFFTEMENDIREDWRGSKDEEHDLRERTYRKMQALEDFKQKFKTRMATGKLAARELLELEEQKKR